MMCNIQNNLCCLDNHSLTQKLKNLDSAYFVSADSVTRKNIILTIDEVILEMMKRGIYDKSIRRSN